MNPASRHVTRGVARFAAIACALALAPGHARAQRSITELPPGASLRVRSPSFGTEPLVGTFDGVRGDTLLLKQAVSPFVVRSIPVVLDHRCRVEVNLEHSTYALQGAAVGGVLGLLFGLSLESLRSGLSSLGGEKPDTSPGPILAGLAIGALAGVAVGSGVPRDEWVPVTFEPSRFGFRIEQPPAELFRAALTIRL